MLTARTTIDQEQIAAKTGCGVFAFACRSDGTVSMSGPIDHSVAQPLMKLMSLVLVDRVDSDGLRVFVDSLTGDESHGD